MNLKLAAVFMIVFLAACGKNNGGSNGPFGGKDKVYSEGVYGLWNAGRYGENGPLKMAINIKIESGRVTATNECTAEGRTEIAEAVSEAEITSTEIIVKQQKNAAKYVSVGGVSVSCQANLKRGSVKYRVDGNKLTLTIPETGESQELSRI